MVSLRGSWLAAERGMESRRRRGAELRLRLSLAYTKQTRKAKRPNPLEVEALSLQMGLGDDLLSHGYTALSSALRRFTVLFGMGRGGANALWSPRIRERP
jgi:hypothetical protein